MPSHLGELEAMRAMRLGAEMLKAPVVRRTGQRPSLSRPARRRQVQVDAICIPGPLFMSPYDRDRFRNSGSKQIYPSSFIQFPSREEAGSRSTPPLVRVRLTVEYRVHSRQMLCVGGSAIPFGWSFLSIAKVPMSWTPGDIWSVEVELPAGSRVEYKYVILEEQDWTQQVNEAAEGQVEYTYRVTPVSSPPDVQRITKQMAIVAWQPGPNRILQVPPEAELSVVQAGQVVERVAPPPLPPTQRSYGQQALGKERGAGPSFPPPPEANGPPRVEELIGVWERLSLDEDGRPLLDRRDVWGRPETGSGGALPPPL